MYLYIYDAFLSNQKYAKLLSNIEQRVTDLDIKGKIARLTILKNVKEVITDAVKSGVETVVAIGDDQTFAKIINVVAPLDVTLAFIPVSSESTIARTLGIPPKEHACDILAGRIVRKIDLGKINNHYFLNSAEITNAKVSLMVGSYAIEPTTEEHTIRLCNIGGQKTDGSVSNPTDGILEAVITPIAKKWFSRNALVPTVLPFKKIRIDAHEDAPVSILTDEQIILKTPAKVEVAPSQLKVIVGHNRTFS